jgi:hypothetical protein
VIGKAKPLNPKPNEGLIAETYANLGCLGMNLPKSTPIWDDPGGRGRNRVIEKSGDREIGKSRNREIGKSGDRVIEKSGDSGKQNL